MGEKPSVCGWEVVPNTTPKGPFPPHTHLRRRNPRRLFHPRPQPRAHSLIIFNANGKMLQSHLWLGGGRWNNQRKRPPLMCTNTLRAFSKIPVFCKADPSQNKKTSVQHWAGEHIFQTF